MKNFAGRLGLRPCLSFSFSRLFGLATIPQPEPQLSPVAITTKPARRKK